MKKILFILLVLGTTTAKAQTQLTAQTIEQVLQEMTLEEKVSLIVGGRNENQPSNGSMIGSTGKLVPGAAGITNAVPRLGIRPTVLTDGPAGVRISATRPGDSRTYYATAFPIGTCLSSMWDTEAVSDLTAALGNEVLEYGCDVLLAPGMNIHRNPLCGRNFEYFSEDPVLTGKIAAAYVKGVQSQGVGTSVKHFAANNQETQRTQNDSRVSQRALREIYLKPFEIAIKESNPWTVMSSYNRLNGPLTQESPELLTTILRDEWGYEGIVMTDWTGPRNTVLQVFSGNEVLEPGNDRQIQDLLEGVKNGKISEETINKAVRRILNYIVKTPRQKGYVYSDAPDLKAHAELVRRRAPEGMVLLKNENNTLPLQETKDPVALFGITAYDLISGGTGSGSVNKAYAAHLSQGLAEAGLTLAADLQALYEHYREYAYSKMIAEDGQNWYWGKPVLSEMEISRKVIDRQAKQSNTAIVCLGRSSGEAWDRKIEGDFNLTHIERQLLNDVCDAFHAEGKEVIVVLNVGGVVETSSWKHMPDAILLAWQPGQEGGRSMADVLTGRANPSGRLPATFPQNAMDHPSSMNFPLMGGNENMGQPRGRNQEGRKNIEYTDYEEGIYVGYRHFQTHHQPVSYPFGYGLSYTTFTYGNAKVKPVKGGFQASVTITNTGKVAGREVVQLYVAAPKGKLEKPESELKAFAKTRELKPGESQTLTMTVNDYDLASYDESKQAWQTDAGTYQIRFASDVETTRATAAYKLSKSLTQQCNDVLKPKQIKN